MSEAIHFADRLESAVRRVGSPAVVGLDPVVERLPRELRGGCSSTVGAAEAIEQFAAAVIDAVAPAVAAVKINSAFFEAYYEWSVAAFYRTIAHAHRRGLLVIADVKRGDIGSTNALYARGHLADAPYDDVDPARVPDAVTLAAYMGRGAIREFIEVARRTGRGLYLLVRPSDPGADEIHEFGTPRRLYEYLAALLRQWSETDGALGECGLTCVGAVVAPKDEASTRALRESLPHTPLLVPGYGAQGATAQACRWCFRADGSGAVINASRSVVYAFETEKYRVLHGDNWQAAIAQAARDFAADVAPCLQPHTR